MSTIQKLKMMSIIQKLELKMQSPYEFNVHTFVVYDYLGIVVFHFVN
jgi:hypothetical protein